MSVFFGEIQCLNPDEINQACAAQGLPTLPVGKANSFRCTLGSEPGRGWVLMTRGVLEVMGLNQLHDLTFDNGKDPEIIVKDLVVISPIVCVTPGWGNQLLKDPNSAYLVELADVRYFAANSRWKQPTILNTAYNVLAPAATKEYYQDTLRPGGLRYTWQTMLNDLWILVAVPELGPSPQMPVTARVGFPKNFRFHGVSAWQAYNEVLTHLNYAFALNPLNPAATRSSLVQLGQLGQGSTLGQAQINRRGRLIWDLYPEVNDRSLFPEKVRVFFPSIREHYGTEESTGWAANSQESTTPLYSVTLTSAVPNTQAGSIAHVYDDLPAIFDFAYAITNQVDLDARAAERANDFYRTLTVFGSIIHQRYAGFLKDAGFLPGPWLSGVAWMDTGGGAASPQGGWVTEIIRHMPPWNPSQWKASDYEVAQNLRNPDLGRISHPLWPPLLQPIKVGEPTQDIDFTNFGIVLRVNPDGLKKPELEENEDCLIFDANLSGSLSPDDVVLARLNGTAISKGEKYPLYVVGKMGDGFAAKITGGTLCSNGVTNPFQIVEQRPLADGGWEDRPNGITSSRAFHANKINYSPSGPVLQVGTIVLDVQKGFAGSPQEYVFDCPAGHSGTFTLLKSVRCVDGRIQELPYFLTFRNGQLTHEPCHVQSGDVCAPCPSPP